MSHDSHRPTAADGREDFDLLRKVHDNDCKRGLRRLSAGHQHSASGIRPHRKVYQDDHAPARNGYRVCLWIDGRKMARAARRVFPL